MIENTWLRAIRQDLECIKTGHNLCVSGIFSIEKLNISIEKVIFSIKKLNIYIEKTNISIKKDSISIKKGNISIKIINISIEKLTFSIKKTNISIEKATIFTRKKTKNAGEHGPRFGGGADHIARPNNLDFLTGFGV